MNKETLSRAKELEADIKCIEALLAEHKKIMPGWQSIHRIGKPVQTFIVRHIRRTT